MSEEEALIGHEATVKLLGKRMVKDYMQRIEEIRSLMLGMKDGT